MPAKPAITEAITESVEANIAAGAYLETAIVAAGVPKATFYDWVRRGKQDEAAGEATEYYAFALRVTTALANVEIELLKKLNQGGQNWQRYAWMLERRFRERWALVKAAESKD